MKCFSLKVTPTGTYLILEVTSGSSDMTKAYEAVYKVGTILTVLEKKLVSMIKDIRFKDEDPLYEEFMNCVNLARVTRIKQELKSPFGIRVPLPNDV